MSTPKSPVPLRFSLVGPGRVGSSLAHWLTARGDEIVTIAGRDPMHCEVLARRLGATALGLDRLQTKDQDLLLVAVSDPALPAVAAELATRPQATVVLHTAGAIDASVLEPLHGAGSSIGSMHPLMAFPEVLEDPAEADGKVFAIDGDPLAVDLASRLARSLNGRPVQVPAQSRPIYHLGASLAAGGVVTLLAAAFEMARREGLPADVREGYLALARGAIEHASRSSDVVSAITGPLARGDLDTFRHQIEVLQGLDPQMARSLGELADLTLRFTSQKGKTGAASRALSRKHRP